MKRQVVLFGLTLLLIHCKKEDSLKIPLHKSSMQWLMDMPTGYTNNTGDTLFTWQFTEVNEYISEGFLPNKFENAQVQRITQTFRIDTLLTYQTVLVAELNNNLSRHDFTSVTLSGTGYPFTLMSGIAEPDYWLDGTFIDSVRLNTVKYTNVFSQSNNQNLEIFVNLDKGLVGFVMDADTFNIVD